MLTSKFSLPACPPFRLDLTVWALRRRRRNIIDSWDGTRYTRVFSFCENPVKVTIEQQGRAPLINITTLSLSPIPAMQVNLTSLLNKMLGLKINLEPFYQFAKKEKKLLPLVKQFMGLKPPRFPSIFESLANAIACQQLSLEVAITLLNRLTQNYGLAFQEGDETHYAFPNPQKIMHCRVQDLRELGFSYKKSEALIGLATAITMQKESFSQLEKKSSKDIENLLSELKGIGRWSIEYALLRGLGRTEIMPGDDVGLQRSLKQLFGFKDSPRYDTIQKVTEKWDPFAGLIYFHLLLKGLKEKGFIED